MTTRLIGAGFTLAVLLYAYALVGETGALLAAAAVFVAVSGSVCLRRSSPRRGWSGLRVPRLRKHQHGVSQLHRLDFEIGRAIESGRRYDHSLRPRLFELTFTLLAKQRATQLAGSSAVRDFLGSELWPLVDPSVNSFTEASTVTANELDALMTKIEELL